MVFIWFRKCAGGGLEAQFGKIWVRVWPLRLWRKHGFGLGFIRIIKESE